MTELIIFTSGILLFGFYILQVVLAVGISVAVALYLGTKQ